MTVSRTPIVPDPHPDVTDDPRDRENVTVLALKRLGKAARLSTELQDHERGCRPCGLTYVRCPEGATLYERECAAWDALDGQP